MCHNIQIWPNFVVAVGNRSNVLSELIVAVVGPSELTVAVVGPAATARRRQVYG